MKDLKIPFAVISFLAVQLGGAVWFASQLDSRVTSLETEDYNEQLLMIKENRRFIREVIMPSYNISDSWNNPHYEAWLKAGGWKDGKK